MENIIKNAISLTRQLIQIPSESSNPLETESRSPEEAVVRMLTTLCKAENICCGVQEALPGRYNFVANFPCQDAPRLLLTAHMDTVSADGMTDPFSGEIRDGKIWGRGSCDDKGPLAVAVSTLMGLKKNKAALKYDVTLLGSIDEECSMSGAAQFAKEAEKFDLCIALEPTKLQLINAHKGVYRCQVKTKGKAAHSSSPELGDNAILSMHSILSDVQQFGMELSTSQDTELGKATLAITQINGGSVINIIPDQCTMSIDVRLLPQHDPKNIAKSIKQRVDDRGSIRKIFAAKAMKSSLDNDHIQHFLSTIGAEGYSDIPTTAAYATDCSKLTRLGPCIVWGPGSIEQAHQSEEFIEVSQIEGACRILSHFLTG